MIYVDTNILIDLLEADPRWCEWSTNQLDRGRSGGKLVSGHIVAAELGHHANSSSELESYFDRAEIELVELDVSAAFLAGRAHREYRERGGRRESLIADFLIGAHALSIGAAMLTRDSRWYRSYFPSLPLITPELDSHG